MSQPAIHRVARCQTHKDWPSAQNQLTYDLLAVGLISLPLSHNPLGISVAPGAQYCSKLDPIPIPLLSSFFFFLIEARIAADLHLCAHQICTWAVLCLSAAPCRLTLFTFFIPLYLHRVTWFRAWIKANCLWRHSAKVAAEKSGSLYTMRVKAHMPHSAHVYGHV